MKLSGWGRYPVIDCATATARRVGDVQRLLATASTLIPRGNGRSYGDAALNPELTLAMTKMDRFQSFDRDSGLLTCEAGVELSDILRTFAPRGWFPPVVPGTKFVTVGGMIATDVHGKNHHVDGSIGSHVESILLVSGTGEPLRCSRAERPGLFRATLGGMGLTGVIVSATVGLTPVKSEFLDTETIATRDLDGTLRTLEESDGWPFNVAWVDAFARGATLGRGLVTRGRWAPEAAATTATVRNRHQPDRRPRVTIPADAPDGLLNAFVGRMFNELYYRLGVSTAARPKRVHYDAFFFPLDRVGSWNRLYGGRGLMQYQCVLPTGAGREGVIQLLEAVPDSGTQAHLAVLKLLGPSGEGLISFPFEGVTLALDFPASRRSVELLARYDLIVSSLGGRVYLAKDACTTAASFREGYPNAEAFTAIRRYASSARGSLESNLSKRLAL